MNDINTMYAVLVEGLTPYEANPELYGEDDDVLEVLEPPYINRMGTEYGERVIYWEQNYNPSYARLGENDSPEAKAIFDVLEEYGLEFDVDLVVKYPADYKDKE